MLVAVRARLVPGQGSSLPVRETALGRRVLFLGSGSLLHDPPTPEQRAKSEERVLAADRASASGSTAMIAINPARDNLVLNTLESGALTDVDGWTVEWVGAEGGGSGHELRTWIAAFAALAATGR
jgi:2,3-dihydroxyphenylpropionate 1,2-dioxygenase